MTKRAFILGGGGVVGIAWETGLVVGLAEAGLDLREADLFVGTSAGSCVAAQITSGLTLDELYQRQIDPALQAIELPIMVNMQQWMTNLTHIIDQSKSLSEIRRAAGALALTTDTVSEPERRAVLLSRLPVHRWSQHQIKIVAVEAQSGERCVFDHNSDVELIDAVTASCAIPGIWPPATIGDHRYIDGGTYSNENADLAVNMDRVLIFAPDVPSIPAEKLETQVELLERNGAQVEIVHPDEAMKAALASTGNPLDPTLREVAARLGREQGHKIVTRIAAFWH